MKIADLFLNHTTIDKAKCDFHSLSFCICLVTGVVIFSLLLTGCSKKKEVPNEEHKTIIWETLLPVSIYYGSPALSIDETTLYIGTSTGFLGSHTEGQLFVALESAAGKEKWRLELGSSEVRSSPAIASDGSIYFTVENRNPSTGIVIGDELWHVSSGGEVLWKYNINPGGLTMEVGQSSPALGNDGTVYVAGDHLYAINPDGTLRWTAFGNTSEMLRNAPVIGTDGTIYFVYHNIPLTALSPSDGSVRWYCSLGADDHCFASPAIGTDGKIYVATQPGLVYAVSMTGQIVWTFNLMSSGFSGILRSSPAIDNAGSVYFGINTGSPSSAFFALNSDGTLKWKFEPADLPSDVPSTHFDIYSSPAIGSDSCVYFGQEFGRVYTLNKSDGFMKSMSETIQGITWSSPAIDKKGILYISDLSGRVYAIRTNSKGLDSNAAWPKFRFDNQNSGRSK
jgi:outer membrane protein assembly factor BamB